MRPFKNNFDFCLDTYDSDLRRGSGEKGGENWWERLETLVIEVNSTERGRNRGKGGKKDDERYV